MTQVTLPIDIRFDEWVAQIRQDLTHLTIPHQDGEENWKSWAQHLLQDNTLDNIPFPDDLSFTEEEGWRRWATYFVDIAHHNI